MTENGDPKENAQVERINNTMKNELLKDIAFHNIEEVKAAVSVAVDFYNNERPHMSIDMMMPAEAAGCSGEIAKRWTSYRLMAIKSRQEGLDIAGNGLSLPECQGFPPVNLNQEQTQSKNRCCVVAFRGLPFRIFYELLDFN